MGTIANKIERFFRGETWLHFATMFFFQTLIIIIFKILSVGNLYLYIIPFFIGFSWEYIGKITKYKPIVLSDIIATIAGGYSINILYQLFLL